MEHVDTQITSHLLAALNLPPIRHLPPSCENCNPNQDQPRPVEPSTSKDACHPVPRDQESLKLSNNSLRETTTAAVKLEKPNPTEPVQGCNAEDNGKMMLLEPAPRFTSSTIISKNITSEINVSPSQAESFATNKGPTTQKLTALGTTPAVHRTSQPSLQTGSAKNTARRARRRWTEAETNDLIKGCHIHGAGNWKRILDDPQFTFIDRSSVDLKDRFRTCFPTEYRKSSTPTEGAGSGSDMSAGQNDEDPSRIRSRNSKYPPKPTKTELEHAELVEKLGLDRHFPKAQRRERREFTAEEDCSLLAGFDLYGASWSKIQSDPALGLGHRRSTDLRDRFRNAYPEKYESAGFKARPRQRVNRIQRSSQKPSGLQQANTANSNGQPTLSAETGKEQKPTRQRDSASFLIQGILEENMSPNWRTPEPEQGLEDQSPAPGSLALDPALNEGFEGSSLEQITEEFLAVARGTSSAHQRSADQVPQDMVRWEDMATHPIFELEPSLTGVEPMGDNRNIVEFRAHKRPVDENDTHPLTDVKKIRT